MKTTVLTLPALALIFGFAAPVSASSDSVAVSNGKTAIVNQQSTCKEGEERNDDTKKCEKKEG